MIKIQAQFCNLKNIRTTKYNSYSLSQINIQNVVINIENVNTIHNCHISKCIIQNQQNYIFIKEKATYLLK